MQNKIHAKTVNFFTGLLGGFVLILLAGCVTQSEPETLSSSAAKNLVDTRWRVEDIDQRGLIDSSNVTLVFDDSGTKFSGSTGCNRYSGEFGVGKDEIRMSKVISTRKLCVQALMNQERRFLSTLAAVRYVEQDEIGFLILRDLENKNTLRLAPETSE